MAHLSPSYSSSTATTTSLLSRLPPPPSELHSDSHSIQQEGAGAGTSAITMAETPKTTSGNLPDSDNASTVEDAELGTSDSTSASCATVDGDEVTSPSCCLLSANAISGTGTRFLVVVGCRLCLTYFMVDAAAPRCPRCGDGRELVRFGG